MISEHLMHDNGNFLFLYYFLVWNLGRMIFRLTNELFQNGDGEAQQHEPK